jgi:hypothetical protein
MKMYTYEGNQCLLNGAIQPRVNKQLLSQLIDYLDIMSLINLCEFASRFTIADKCTERDSFK